MKKLFKSISVACISALLLTSFAGCAGKTDGKGTGGSASTTAAKQETAKAKDVTLRFAWWGTDLRHKATLAAIDAYTKKNPNVKIEAEYMGFDGYDKKMFTQLAGDTAPDVFQFNRDWFPNVQSQGEMLADLGKLKDMDLKQFNESLLKGSGTYKGKVIMVPSGVVGMTAVYNKDFFAKHGIAEEAAWTWEKMLEVGKSLHQKDKNAYLTTADIDVLNRLIFGAYIDQKTGKYWVNDDYTVNVTKADVVEALQFIVNAYESGVIEPFGEGSVFTGKMEQNPKWIKGEIGMLLDVTNGVSKYKSSIPNAKVTVTALPVRKDAKISGVDYSGNTGFSINSKSKNLDEAAKFLNWLVCDKEAALILTDVRGVPAAASALKVLNEENKLDADLVKAVDNSSKNSYSINIVSMNTELMQIRKDVLQKVIFKKTTPEQGADDIMKGYEAKLKDLKASAK